MLPRLRTEYLDINAQSVRIPVDPACWLTSELEEYREFMLAKLQARSRLRAVFESAWLALIQSRETTLNDPFRAADSRYRRTLHEVPRIRAQVESPQNPNESWLAHQLSLTIDALREGEHKSAHLRSVPFRKSRFPALQELLSFPMRRGPYDLPALYGPLEDPANILKRLLWLKWGSRTGSRSLTLVLRGKELVQFARTDGNIVLVARLARLFRAWVTHALAGQVQVVITPSSNDLQSPEYALSAQDGGWLLAQSGPVYAYHVKRASSEVGLFEARHPRVRFAQRQLQWSLALPVVVGLVDRCPVVLSQFRDARLDVPVQEPDPPPLPADQEGLIERVEGKSSFLVRSRDLVTDPVIGEFSSYFTARSFMAANSTTWCIGRLGLA